MIKIYSQVIEYQNVIAFYAYDNERSANICLDLEVALNPEFIITALISLIRTLYELDHIPYMENK